MKAILNNKTYELYAIKEDNKTIIKAISKNDDTIILNEKENKKTSKNDV